MNLLLVALLAQEPALPEGDAKKIVEKICFDCHGAETIVKKKRTKDEWEEVIQDMVQNGAQGTDDEFNKIEAYLVKNFGKK